MGACSDDVFQSTDESLAELHQDRKTVSKGLLRTIQQSSLRGNSPSVSVYAVNYGELRFVDFLMLLRQAGEEGCSFLQEYTNND
ncbi:unnamed protein product [Protopolystoma xenopodis]|uniref:Uncharacterized protein n=1 Tax=Protopolystoma xenopodis TaxID=117903 RepID=A0A3S5ARE8_9PLAT|nr:unnamed protein product [Protopolystoma xenopodis]